MLKTLAKDFAESANPNARTWFTMPKVREMLSEQVGSTERKMAEFLAHDSAFPLDKRNPKIQS